MTPDLPFIPESERWLALLHSDGRSTSTLDCYARDLRDVSAAIGGVTLGAFASVDQATIDRMAARWSDSGVVASTIYRRFSAVRGFARYLANAGKSDCAALLALDYPECVRSKRSMLSVDEVHLVVRSAHSTGDWTAARDAAAFSIQAGSGLTPAETVALNVRDVQSRSIRVTSTTFKSRIVGVDEDSTALIDRYRAAAPFPFPAAGPLFLNRRGRRLSERTLQLSFRRRRSECGLAGPCGPSSLRKNHAGLLVADGFSPDELAEALGLHVSSVFRFFGGVQQ